MFLVQTSRAKRTRKYSILMLVCFLVNVSIGAILTMHWDVPPNSK
jgi:hypothetical protein